MRHIIIVGFLLLVLFTQLNVIAQVNESAFDSTYDSKQAIEYFAIGNSMLQSHIDGEAKWSDVLEQAVDQFDKATRLNPKFIEAYYNKGICYIRGAGGHNRLQYATRCFDAILDIDTLFTDAYFAKAYAHYYIETGAKAQGGDAWNRAVRPAIAMFNAIIDNYPNSDAAQKSRQMLRFLEWDKEEGFKYNLFGKSKTRPPEKPSLIPMKVQGTEKIQKSVASTITKVKTGIIADDVVKIWVAHHGSRGQYSADGRVENTDGMRLHQFYISVAPHEVQYDDSFKALYINFTYDGKKICKQSMNLPDAGLIAMAARDGNLPNEPIATLSHENVRTKFIIVGADVDPASRTYGYTSINLRVITEVVE